MELEGDGGSGFFPQGNGYYSNYNAIRSTISSALSGLSMVAGAHSQFGIIAPDKGVVLAGHSFIIENNDNYQRIRREFLDSLPDFKEQN